MPPPLKNSEASLGGEATRKLQDLELDNRAAPAPAQTEREQFWHALAVQHLQRARVIELLVEMNCKLGALLEIAMKKGGLP